MAMLCLAIAYYDGEKGLTKDLSSAYEWYKRGAETTEGTHSQVSCLGLMSFMTMNGEGV